MYFIEVKYYFFRWYKGDLYILSLLKKKRVNLSYQCFTLMECNICVDFLSGAKLFKQCFKLLLCSGELIVT